MKFLWSMRNRKKTCKTLVYGLLSGGFLALQPKAWQKSLILLVIVMSRFLIIQALTCHTRAAGVCTSPKISFGEWEYMYQSQLEQEPGKGLWCFLKDWCETGYPAGGVLDTEMLNSACSLGASPRQLWGLCVGCRGGRRESTAVSPAWAALLQCHKGRALHLLWLCGWQGTPAACFRSFGVLRGSATERFLCAASLGRLSSNGLTRYL